MTDNNMDYTHLVTLRIPNMYYGKSFKTENKIPTHDEWKKFIAQCEEIKDRNDWVVLNIATFKND